MKILTLPPVNWSLESVPLNTVTHHTKKSFCPYPILPGSLIPLCAANKIELVFSVEDAWKAMDLL